MAVSARAIGLDVQDQPDTGGLPGVIVVRGPLTHHPECPALDSYDDIMRRAGQAFVSEDGQDARPVWLVLDSPGGEASGLLATCRGLRRLSEQTGRPLYAYVEGQASSAAYALACSADRIFAAPDAKAGSIGVIEIVVDTTSADAQAGFSFELVASSPLKGRPNPHETLSEAAREEVQRNVDDVAELFFAWVAERRDGLDARPLEARTYIGAEALRRGLIDELSPTFSEARGQRSDLVAPVSAGPDIIEQESPGNSGARTMAMASDEKTKSKLRAAILRFASEDSADGAIARRLIDSEAWDGDAGDDGDDAPPAAPPKKDDAPPAPPPKKSEDAEDAEDTEDAEDLEEAIDDAGDADEEEGDAEIEAVDSEDARRASVRKSQAKMAAAKARAALAAGNNKLAQIEQRAAKRASREAALFTAAARIQRWEHAQAVAAQRKQLMATRPDLSRAVRALAEDVPVDQLKKWLSKIPKGAHLTASGTQAAIAAQTGTSEYAVAPRPKTAGHDITKVNPQMLAAAGINIEPAGAGIRVDNTETVPGFTMGVLTPAQARELLSNSTNKGQVQ